MEMVDEGLRRAVNSREGSRAVSREGGGRGEGLEGPAQGFGGLVDEAPMTQSMKPRSDNRGKEEGLVVNSIGSFEPEIERRMKEASGEEKYNETVVAPKGLFGVGMTTDDFDFETPELLDLKPIYALGTETLFPDKEDEEERERRAAEQAAKEKKEAEILAAKPKSLVPRRKETGAGRRAASRIGKTWLRCV